jgi:hypothetical protein
MKGCWNRAHIAGESGGALGAAAGYAAQRRECGSGPTLLDWVLAMLQGWGGTYLPFLPYLPGKPGRPTVHGKLNGGTGSLCLPQ